MVIQKIWDGTKHAWKSVNESLDAAGTTGLGWAEEGLKAAGKILGSVPIIGSVFGGLSYFVDRKKDALIQSKLSNLAKNVGELREGLNDVKNQLESQGKELHGKIDGVKEALEGELKQQGQKHEQEIKDLDARLTHASGENRKIIEEEIRQRKAEYQQIQNQIQEVTQNLEKAQQELKKELEEFKQEVNERFEEQERKILANKHRIEEEKHQREQEIQEVKDKISLTNRQAENLQKEKDELLEDFQKAHHQTTRKMEELHQEFDDYQAETSQQFRLQETKFQQTLEEAQTEFETKSRQIDAQLKDHQEILAEHEEDLASVKYEQKKQNILNQEIYENLQETNDIIFAQQRKLALVSSQMEDIQEEVHLRMNKLSKEVNQKTEQTLTIAKDAHKKVDRLTQDVQQMRNDLENMEEQVQKNKEETEKVKQQAQQTNQRIDNLLKTQSLMDFSAEQSNLDKIKKSLELKAEEAKLIATLNLLKETKNLVHLTANKEWKVGIKTGTDTEIKGSEGMLLDPNSSWAKQYTPEQLQEWGWDTRLLGEHEKAQLLSEDQDKKQTQQESVQSPEQEGEEVPVSEAAQQVLEEVNKVQTEILKKLQTIQEEIQSNLSAVESVPPPLTPPPPPSATTTLQVIQAESKVKIKQKALQRQKQAERETKIRAKTNPTKQNIKQVQEEEKETKKAETALQQAQEELTALEKKQEFEELLENKEKELEAKEAEEVKQQWQQIQALSVQSLHQSENQENPEELDLEKKLEEIAQQIQEQEAAQVASQKTMTRFMLFLIIFLMEYVVYKKNGLSGLVILNIILLICYWYKDQLMEYADLFGHYLLIIGYVMGNVLAYNSVDNPNYKMPMVYGFNAAVGLVYAYTYWQKLGGKQLAEKTYQQQLDKLREEYKVSQEEWQQIRTQSQPQSNTWSEKIKNTVSHSEHNIYSTASFQQKTQELTNLQEFILHREAAEQKDLEMQKQAQTLQKAAEIEQQLKDNLEKASQNLKEPPMSWQLIREKYPEFTGEIFFNELKKAENLLKSIGQNTEKGTATGKTLLARLTKLSTPSEAEQTLLSHLQLTLEQYIALSLKTPYLTREEKDWITQNYLALTQSAKFQLLNAGLNALEINTYEKKEKLVHLLISCWGERELFGLSTKEKENILRFLSNTLNLSEEQKNYLEEMGISFFNASEWEITNEQKDHLLDFGLNKLTLTAEQKEQLITMHPERFGFTEEQDKAIAKNKKYKNFKVFSLTGQQKNILNSLAPLIREDKYSEESLQLLKSLHLKPATSTFLVQEEIIPDPHTAFGTVKSSYLPLKEKFLIGEQKILRTKLEKRRKGVSEEQIRNKKTSIVNSLWNLIGKYYYLHALNYTLDEWVSKKHLLDWQRDILLTVGFKTVPKYNYFELFIFAVNNFTNLTFDALLEDKQKKLDPRKLEELRTNFAKYCQSQQKQSITINETIWGRFVATQKGETMQPLNLKELARQVSNILGGWNPPVPNEEENISKNQEIPPAELTNPEPEASTSSKYDNLLANLDKEAAERQRKKLEREETRKKLQESELVRRQANLSEKDRKLKEEQEKRQKELELAQQEAQIQEQARLAREQALKEEQENFLKTQQKNYEEKQKQREQNYQNQVREAELAEKKKQADLDELERKNRFNQQQLEKNIKLLEEETKKKLEQIAADDQAARQEILKKQKEDALTLQQRVAEQEQELLNQKRKKESELNKLKEENRLALERAAQALAAKKEKDKEELENMLKQGEQEKLAAEQEIQKLKRQKEIENILAQESQEKAKQREEAAKALKKGQNAVERHREFLWEKIKDYYWSEKEAKNGTRSPQQTSGGKLRDWLVSSPHMEFNLYAGDSSEYEDTNWSSYRIAMKAFYSVMGGSVFVNQYRFQELMKEKIKDTKTGLD